MAYALVGTIGAASQGAVGAAVTPAFGQATTSGNLLICFVAVNGVNTIPTTPSGWSVAKTFQNTGTTTTSVGIFYLIAAGADSAPTIAAITSGIIAAQLAEFSGNSSTPLDQSGGNFVGTSPLTVSFATLDAAIGELVVLSGADTRTAARATNDTWTLNSGTITQAGSNNGVSSVNHYSFAYCLGTTSNPSDQGILTASITTSQSSYCGAGASFKLAPPPVPLPEFVQQPLQPAHYAR